MTKIPWIQENIFTWQSKFEYEKVWLTGFQDSKILPTKILFYIKLTLTWFTPAKRYRVSGANFVTASGPAQAVFFLDSGAISPRNVEMRLVKGTVTWDFSAVVLFSKEAYK